MSDPGMVNDDCGYPAREVEFSSKKSGSTRVLVVGAAGRMGQEVVKAVTDADGMEVVAAVDPMLDVIDIGLFPQHRQFLDLKCAIADAKPDVMVDFTNADAAVRNVDIALRKGVSAVVGTTGHDLQWWDKFYAKRLDLLGSIPALFVAPNFALQTIATIQAAIAFVQTTQCGVEIIERHRRAKADSPSGTAIWAAQQIAPFVPKELRWSPNQDGPGLGYNVEGVRVHAIRGHGYLACLEIICTHAGGTTVFLDEVKDRASYMPGVLIALEAMTGRRDQFIGGLDKLISGKDDWNPQSLLDMD